MDSSGQWTPNLRGRGRGRDRERGRQRWRGHARRERGRPRARSRGDIRPFEDGEVGSALPRQSPERDLPIRHAQELDSNAHRQFNAAGNERGFRDGNGYFQDRRNRIRDRDRNDRDETRARSIDRERFRARPMRDRESAFEQSEDTPPPEAFDRSWDRERRPMRPSGHAVKLNRDDGERMPIGGRFISGRARGSISDLQCDRRGRLRSRSPSSHRRISLPSSPRTNGTGLAHRDWGHSVSTKAHSHSPRALYSSSIPSHLSDAAAGYGDFRHRDSAPGSCTVSPRSSPKPNSTLDQTSTFPHQLGSRLEAQPSPQGTPSIPVTEDVDTSATDPLRSQKSSIEFMDASDAAGPVAECLQPPPEPSSEAEIRRKVTRVGFGEGLFAFEHGRGTEHEPESFAQISSLPSVSETAALTEPSVAIAKPKSIAASVENPTPAPESAPAATPVTSPTTSPVVTPVLASDPVLPTSGPAVVAPSVPLPADSQYTVPQAPFGMSQTPSPVMVQSLGEALPMGMLLQNALPTLEEVLAEEASLPSQGVLLSQIQRIDELISEHEDAISRRRSSLEHAKQEEPDSESESDKEDSTPPARLMPTSSSVWEPDLQANVDRIYSENHRLARMALLHLSRARPPWMADIDPASLFYEPLYTEPSGVESFGKIEKAFARLRVCLFRVLRRRLLDKSSKHRKLALEWWGRYRDWLSRFRTLESTSTKPRSRTTKLRKTQEDVPQTRPGMGMNPSNELVKKTMAPVPTQFLYDSEKRRVRFLSRNGLVDDPRLLETQRKLVNPWSEEEEELFKKKYQKYPKSFHKIASYFANKTVGDCVAHYYSSKTLVNYKQLARKYRRSLSRKNANSATTPSVDVAAGNTSMPALPSKSGVRSREPNISRELLNLAADLSRSGMDIQPGRSRGTKKRERDLTSACDAPDRPKTKKKTKEKGSSRVTREKIKGKGRGKGKSVKAEATLVAEEKAEEVGAETTEVDEKIIGVPLASGDSRDVDAKLRRSSSSGVRPSWHAVEKQRFLEGIDRFGKEFMLISEYIGTKSIEKCKNYFNNNKKRLQLNERLELRPHSSPLLEADVVGTVVARAAVPRPSIPVPSSSETGDRGSSSAAVPPPSIPIPSSSETVDRYLSSATVPPPSILVSASSEGVDRDSSSPAVPLPSVSVAVDTIVTSAAITPRSIILPSSSEATDTVLSTAAVPLPLISVPLPSPSEAVDTDASIIVVSPPSAPTLLSSGIIIPMADDSRPVDASSSFAERSVLPPGDYDVKPHASAATPESTATWTQCEKSRLMASLNQNGCDPSRTGSQIHAPVTPQVRCDRRSSVSSVPSLEEPSSALDAAAEPPQKKQRTTAYSSVSPTSQPHLVENTAEEQGRIWRLIPAQADAQTLSKSHAQVQSQSQAPAQSQPQSLPQSQALAMAQAQMQMQMQIQAQMQAQLQAQVQILPQNQHSFALNPMALSGLGHFNQATIPNVRRERIVSTLNSSAQSQSYQSQSFGHSTSGMFKSVQTQSQQGVVANSSLAAEVVHPPVSISSGFGGGVNYMPFPYQVPQLDPRLLSALGHAQASLNPAMAPGFLHAHAGFDPIMLAYGQALVNQQHLSGQQQVLSQGNTGFVSQYSAGRQPHAPLQPIQPTHQVGTEPESSGQAVSEFGDSARVPRLQTEPLDEIVCEPSSLAQPSGHIVESGTPLSDQPTETTTSPSAAATATEPSTDSGPTS